MPTDQAAQFRDALALHKAGRPADARERYQSLLSEVPQHPWVWHYLGVAELQVGRVNEALRCLRISISFEPSISTFHGNLGEAAAPTDLRIAARIYHRAIACDPSFAAAYGNLVGRCQGMEPADVLLRLARRHASLDPASSTALSNLGVLFSAHRLLPPAESALLRAAALTPRSAPIRVNLSRLYELTNRHDQRIEALRAAVRLDPALPGAYNNLGRAYLHAGRMTEAQSTLRQAVAQEPDEADALSNLGLISQTRHGAEVAATFGARAVALDPKSFFFRSNKVLALLYQDSTSASALFSAARVSSPRSLSPAKQRAVGRDARPLRIGFVSGDLRKHAVGDTLLPIVEAIDRSSAEVYLYANVERPDEVTSKFRASADGWRMISEENDAGVADLIRNDAIDVLVSVAGHTAGGRLPIFALKPAPVQVALFDVTTTGLHAIDYWIGDEYTVPARTEEQFTETVIRLPCWSIFARPPEEPAPSSPPAIRSGRITFGCVNNPAKFSRTTLTTWASVLHAVPQSRLLLKYMHFYKDDVLRGRILQSFLAQGIGEDRIEFESTAVPGADHLAIYNQIDVALDPFPFVGCNTTFEALWMGVPVVTLAGQRFIARMGAGILPFVGLDRLVAADLSQYVEIATALASDAARLAELRHDLRGLLSKSPLCDADRYAVSLVSALQRAHEA